MPRFLLTIKYDGSNYCGWQVQPNAVSVQSTIQKALIDLTGESELCVTGCSRTDSGVHANMFCLHFDSMCNIPAERIPFALNMRLPNDIVVFGCREVADDFHARYSSIGKTYVYKIYNSQFPDPFKYKYFLTVNRHIDESVLDKAAKCFIGTHDFKGFCSAGSSVVDTVKTVSQCDVKRVNDDVFVSITADGFLYNMVRIIVGTLLEINEGKINPCELTKIISSCDRNLAGYTVKAHGLYLEKVHYDFK